MLVFNAARAQHLGGKLDQADELYQLFLRLPGIAPELADKAKVYLREIQLARANERGEEAMRLAHGGRHLEAASAWRSAYRQAPSRSYYLLRAARAARLGRDAAGARGDYLAYLAASQPGPERDEAQRELDLLNSPPHGPAEATPTAAVAPVAIVPTVPAPATARVGHFTSHVGLFTESVSGAGASGSAIGLEASAGWHRARNFGALVMMRASNGFGASSPLAASVGLGLRREFDDWAAVVGPELVWARGSTDVVCGGTTCTQQVLFESVARGRLRWQWLFSAVGGMALDGTLGIGLDSGTLQGAWAVALSLTTR